MGFVKGLPMDSSQPLEVSPWKWFRPVDARRPSWKSRLPLYLTLLQSRYRISFETTNQIFQNLSGVFLWRSGCARSNLILVRLQMLRLSAILYFSRYRISSVTSGGIQPKLRIKIPLSPRCGSAKTIAVHRLIWPPDGLLEIATSTFKVSVLHTVLPCPYFFSHSYSYPLPYPILLSCPILSW